MTARTFIATTGSGLARAELRPDGRWTVASLLEGEDVRCLAAAPSDPAVVFAGTQGRGVLRSRDGGRRWEPAGLPGRIVKALAVSPAAPGVVYAGTKRPAQVFVSPDGGETWAEREAFRRIPSRWRWFSPAEWPPTPYVQALAPSPTDPDVIVAGIEAGAVVRSEDGGRNWSDHRPGAVRDCHTLAFHAASGDWVYEAGGGGAAVSRDGGRTWQRPKTGLDRRYGWACAADPAHPDTWYVSASPFFTRARPGPPAAHVDGHAHAYVFRSRGGGPWQKLAGGLPQPLDYMAYALLTDPAAPGHVYAGLSNGDVWHSADFGDAWERLPFNLGRIERTLVLL